MSASEDPIYLDHNATTPVLPEAVEAMMPYLREHFGNPSSAHVYGKRAQRAVERAREQVASLIGCMPSEIVFTSGGTEANNLAIRGVAAARDGRRGIISSAIEHPATAQCCQSLEQRGWSVTNVDVDEDGRVIVEQVREAIGEDTALVTVMHANNETGVIQPVDEIAKLAHEAGASVHTDAAQSVGKVAVGVEELGVDLLSVAGHKLYAPKGVGALYIRRGTPLKPLLLGAGHEGGLRPGTENVASIVGFGKACEYAASTLKSEGERIEGLRELLWDLLRDGIDGIKLNGHREKRLPNTLNVRFPDISGYVLLEAAPQVAASTASACHGSALAASDVILAMGVAPEKAQGSVRLSLGRSTTREDIHRAATALIGAWNSQAGS